MRFSRIRLSWKLLPRGTRRSQELQAQSLEESWVAFVFSRFHRSLTAAVSVSDQPFGDEMVDLAQRLPRVPEVEVAFPPRGLPVDLRDQLRQRLETMTVICQFANP